MSHATPHTDLSNLATEAPNPRSAHIDRLPTLDMLQIINDEDATVAAAVRAELPHIAAAVDAIADRFRRGGRLFYIGAGTSGRLGVLDASECPPTFSVPPDLFHAIIAGGDTALRISSESSEDSPQQGADDLHAAGFGQPAQAPTDARAAHTPAPDAPDTPIPDTPAPDSPDTLIAIAASGRTPFVLGALRHARSLGALTIALTCTPGSPMAELADIAIAPLTGPEVLTGSTRLKAGTATKLVLNMLSTAVMIRSGAVFGNLMVNVQPTNAKLVDRALRIVITATGCDRPTAQALLQTSGDVKLAILMAQLQIPLAEARTRLSEANGNLRAALA